MIPSPLLASGSLTTFSIKVEGQEIPSTFQVQAIDAFIAVNRLPKARLILLDGSPSTGDFAISNLSIFLPGNKVVIAAGYNSLNTDIFTGIVVKQGLEITQTQQSQLIVELTDQAMAMTLERKNAVFGNSTDSALMTTLIQSNGLTANVTATSIEYEDIVQYYATDWDMLLMRAELNGFLALIAGGAITVGAPDTSQTPVLSVVYGDSILELHAELDASTQYKSSAIKSSAWDESTQQVIESGPGSVSFNEQGNLTSDTLAATFNVTTYAQQTGAMLESSSLQAWSSAELLKSRLAKIRGTVKFQGSALAQPGKMIQLGGLGNRFNGAAYISAVRQRITDGQWMTTTTFGLAWPWFSSETPDITAPGASGQLPAINGLQTGKVKQVSADPAGEFRVLISLPLLGADAGNVWARLSTMYASNQIGTVFYPEVDDEVIVSFMNNDPRYPVILGAVYSKQLPPPYPPDQNNIKKAIVTRSKLEMTFDDQNKVVEIKTPGNRKVRLDDNAGTITISDSNSNTVTLSSSGISLDSGSDISITAKQNITITAQAALTMSANTKASLKGTASGELISSGELTIRGAIVAIN